MEILVIVIILAVAIYFAGYRRGERQAGKDLEKHKQKLEKDFTKAKRELELKLQQLNKISSCSFIFERVASLYADLQTYVYDEIVYGLVHRHRPAFRAADEVRESKTKTKKAIEEYKCMQYKYEFLMNQFPTLKEYVDDYEAVLSSQNNSSTIEEADYLHDRVRDWISEEAYRKLDINTRNQLALNNWLKHRKLSNVQVGYEYELYIGYLYRSKGWSVVQFGIDRGLEDLGRDIIASKIVNGKHTIHIIQCKRWSEKKTIHENVITQLYGTCVQYKLSHNLKCNCMIDIVPILYTTIAISNTANEFANYLNVIVKVVPMGDYPRIKCNINRTTGEKIYHLPFDQQYYTSKIEQPGEFYAFSIKEAVEKGFRRAYRHTSN